MFRSTCQIALVAMLPVMAGPAAFAQDEAPSLADIIEAWLASPHGDRMSEAFTHWDEDGEIPGRCAVCHSSSGAVNYFSGPMTTPGILDHPVTLGTTVDCVACHNRAATELAAVPFPSGVMVDVTGPSAVCTVCHQGRASTETVARVTEGMDEDVVVGDLPFINVHYAPSASTQMGGVVRGGYEYPGKDYQGRFDHVPDLAICTDCHNPHSLKVELQSCTACHQGVGSFEEIRISPTDFDGDGNTSEGIADPIATLHNRLGVAMQAYASKIAGTKIAYAPSAYPYFFIDSDGDGSTSEGEAIYPNRYQSWTPRLLKAAYNYQLVAKEPAIFTHNPHYALQVLYDSLESLSARVDVDLSGLSRP